MRASASAGARGASAGEGDAWGRDSRGGMRRRHQHGVKDYSISHSWARKENKKRREGKSGSDQLSHRENTPHTSPLAVPVPLPHPPAPLVSISETAFGLQKEIATPRWPDPRLLIIKESSWRAARALASFPFLMLLLPSSFRPHHAVSLPEEL